MPWDHFTRDEFACKGEACCGHSNLIEDSFIDKLERLRKTFGFAFPVASGYRCPIHNQRVSTTGPNGPHTTGRAADLSLDRLRAFMVMSSALGSGEFTGIGIKQHGPARFLHLDDLEAPAHPRPTLWSYP